MIRAKILKTSNKKNSNGCVKLIRKQEIKIFLAARENAQQKLRKFNK